MEMQYEYTARMAELCNLLEDQLSKDIFWARLQFDCDSNWDNVARLYELTGFATEEELYLRRNFASISNQLKAEGKKLFLYGTAANGQLMGSLLLRGNGDFYAYCARNHEKYAEGVLGKPVYSPDYVFEHPKECYVLIVAIMSAKEIYNNLIEHHFPQDHIFQLTASASNQQMLDHQYFDFPELYPKGKAFVDAGCYDCGTSIMFAKWCGGDYSKILAFEPDPKNCQKCQDIADKAGLRLELFPFGLTNRAETVCFAANTSGDSAIIRSQETQGDYANTRRVKEEITVKTIALDEAVQGEEIGYIKMDIEGSELKALKGAEQTLLRDKPFLALSVYHRKGDVLAIMDYLHTLVPEYHFWLRHYSAFTFETVLYASAVTPEQQTGGRR